jgi:uncharacterized protein YfaS (alpha-2-macroglobulin family)
MPVQTKLKIRFIIFMLLGVTLACGMPRTSQPVTQTPILSKPVENLAGEEPLALTRPPSPTATSQPLPPTLVEVDPPPGSVFPLQGSLTLFFNQPMDRPSVEIALTGQPALAGRFDWVDDTTVTFELDAPFLPDTDLTFNLSTSALSTTGLFLQEPVEINYHTASPLKALQVLPEPDSQEVDLATAVVVTFNQPIVSFDIDPGLLPEAFSVDPASPGLGKWVNTSTYIFYPDPALAGGTNYTVQLNPELRSTAGGPFVGREVFETSPFEWSFRTALPHLVSLLPGDGATAVRLDSTFRVEFSQPMEADSVEDNFSVYGPDQHAIAGEYGWSEDFTTLSFTPTQLLARNTSYNVILLGASRALGGTPLSIDYVARVSTVPALRITYTEPANGGSQPHYSALAVHFNGPAELDNPLDYLTFSPEVPNVTHWWDDLGRTLYLSGEFEPISVYTATLAATFPDPWDGTLGEVYTFSFQTPLLDPSLAIAPGETTLLLAPQEPTITAQATNINEIYMRLGSIPFGDLVSFLSPGGYELIQKYRPADQRNWTYHADLPGDKNYSIQLPVTPDDKDLPPGIYYLGFLVPELPRQLPAYLLISSNIQLSFKISTTSAFVWAVDTRTYQPVQGASVVIYDSFGNRLSSGPTDTQGIFQSPIPTQPDLYSTYYAVLGKPGDENFSLCLSTWSQGIEAYDYGVNADFTSPNLSAYVYTDLPIYRPGQIVHLRAVIRHEHNGRYALPGVEVVPVTVYDADYLPVLKLDLPLSEFGTIRGEFEIPDNSQPGYYQVTTPYGAASFQVVEYHKPAINLQIDSPDAALVGEVVLAQLNARYFFDSPAENVPLTWRIYRDPVDFYLPGYQVGIDQFRWLEPPWRLPGSPLGEFIEAGESRTNPQGFLTLELPTDSEVDSPYLYTLESNLANESGFPISARANITVHPSDFYIGVRPDAWVGQAGVEIGFEILTVDWGKQPAGERDLVAKFQEVTWVRKDSSDPFTYPVFSPQYIPISSADFCTAQNGIARLAFTPPEAGTYQLDISGGGARTQVLVWVGGTGQVTWPNLPNNHLQITADKDGYVPGDTANVFIPNPFDAGAQALVTIERDEILRYEVLTLDTNGYNYLLPLSDQDAPNIYLSITLIGKDADHQPDFRQGYLSMAVEPDEQVLNVELNAIEPGDPLQKMDVANLKDVWSFEPHDEITLSLRLTSSDGSPVQGEFSIAVVDLAALLLTDPKPVDILTAFYGEQPLGIRTSMSLAVAAQRRINVPGDIGGGGEVEESVFIRQDFPVTAYWNAEIVTDANGEAEVNIPLPYSLTTWEVDVCGLTADTRIGLARGQIVTTKDLLVRPVTPRFLVVGDHTQLGAVIQNNTDRDFQVDVTLQGSGFKLDDPSEDTQALDIPAGSRLPVAWWGKVEDLPYLDLTFSARGGGYQDTARPMNRDIPVLRFAAPQTFGTSGILDMQGERLETISLPPTFNPFGGTLQVGLAPSLAAAMVSGLDVLEKYPYGCTEQTLSRFLPNLTAYIAIQDLGLDSPDLLSRLERTLGKGIQELSAQQNEDGGWGWWPAGRGIYGAGVPMGQESDDIISAYVVFGLTQARSEGAFVDEAVLQKGINYLLATMPALEMLSSNWQLDRLAFYYFALAQAGSGNAATARDFFEVRDQLSPYAKAFLALTLDTYNPADELIDVLFSDLETTAIQTPAGIHWEGNGVQVNLDTPIFNTAVVVYAIAQHNPASYIIPEALRYLMSQRQADGSWGSTYETTWTLMGLTEVMKGTGELAGDYGFVVVLNGEPLLEGQAGGDARLNPVISTIPVSELNPDNPNGLSIQRTSGPGRLYYAVFLDVLQPAQDILPLNGGINVNRVYQAAGGDAQSEVNGQPAAVGELVSVRIAVTLENDAYYLMVEDYLPAGAEILETSLNTYPIGSGDCGASPAGCYAKNDPFADGWGWWLFKNPMIYDDHIAWATEYLPAGSYELTYTLVLTHPGEFQVLPARAWSFYFPEMQGNSAGDLFLIGE